MSAPDPHANADILEQGVSLDAASAAMVLLHGRGGAAQDILGLTGHIGAPGFAYLAPHAAGNTWYPHSFLMPLEKNEPYLTSALETVDRVLSTVLAADISAERIVFAGFSQGACLVAEFVARNARRYGGLLVFSGGLIGPPGTSRNYEGDLSGTPVFLGCSDVDPHIPEERVDETEEVFSRMGGNVDKRIYPGMAHTINRDELDAAQGIVASIIG